MITLMLIAIVVLLFAVFALMGITIFAFPILDLLVAVGVILLIRGIYLLIKRCLGKG